MVHDKQGNHRHFQVFEKRRAPAGRVLCRRPCLPYGLVAPASCEVFHAIVSLDKCW